MAIKLNFANERDFVKGRILYKVSAYLTKDSGNANIGKIIITRKYISELTGSLFAEGIIPDSEFHSENFIISLLDHNIPRNVYNVHEVFTDLESAMKYKELVDAVDIKQLLEIGCLTDEKIEKIRTNSEA